MGNKRFMLQLLSLIIGVTFTLLSLFVIDAKNEVKEENKVIINISQKTEIDEKPKNGEGENFTTRSKSEESTIISRGSSND